MSAGAWLGGEKCVMLMQSSGVGNCINMLSLISDLPVSRSSAFVTMRGQWHEFNPWQMPMGTTTKAGAGDGGSAWSTRSRTRTDVGAARGGGAAQGLRRGAIDGAAVGAAFGPGQDVW